MSDEKEQVKKEEIVREIKDPFYTIRYVCNVSERYPKKEIEVTLTDAPDQKVNLDRFKERLDKMVKDVNDAIKMN